MPQGLPSSLRDWLLTNTGHDRYFWARDAKVSLADLAHGTSLNDSLQQIEGSSALIATREQLTTALALIELDGVARRLTLLPPDMRPEYLPAVVANAQIDAIVTDDPAAYGHLGVAKIVTCSPTIQPTKYVSSARPQNEWVLFTSGTTVSPRRSSAATAKASPSSGAPTTISAATAACRYSSAALSTAAH
jgi:hypothetical protein